MARNINSPEELSKILHESGIPEQAQTYLTARGFRTPALMARAGKDDTAFQEILIQPFIAGFKIGEQEYKNIGDQALVAASMLVAWDAAVAYVRAAQTASEAQQSSGRPAAEMGGSAPAGQPPKTLGPGDWVRQITAYESKWSPKRIFPS